MKILDIILDEAYGVVPGDPIGDAIKQAQQKKAQPKLQSKPSTVQPQPVTGSPLENTLRSLAIKAGILGQELAQFLAQCAHETANFSTLTEFGDSKTFSRYDPKFNPSKAKELGNVMPGDGERFKGRGFIQITGRYNYTQAGEALGLPLDKNPQLLENPNVAAQASIWFWKNKVKPKVSNFTDTKAVTSVINPALRGLQQRHRAFQDYIKTTLTPKQSVREENIKLVAKHYFPVDDEEIIIQYRMKKDSRGYYLPEFNTSGRMFNLNYSSLIRLYGHPHTIKIKNVDEGKKKKRKKQKYAAYGPGPFGLYGVDAGYSGDGGVEENFTDGSKFVEPNFNNEWEEAERYPEFVKLGKDAWIELARKGKAITINSAQDISNTDAADPDSFKSLVPAKQKRALAQLEKGTVEMPIVAVYSDGHKELIGGNTRLTAMMARDGKATVWAFRVPDEVTAIAENFADGKVKGKSRPGRVKRAGASCNGSVTDLRQRAKNASGERAKMYHWCANMKSGKKK